VTLGAQMHGAPGVRAAVEQKRAEGRQPEQREAPPWRRERRPTTARGLLDQGGDGDRGAGETDREVRTEGHVRGCGASAGDATRGQAERVTGVQTREDRAPEAPLELDALRVDGDVAKAAGGRGCTARSRGP
jgi:hypothetical protein